MILLLARDRICKNLSVLADPGCSGFSIHPLITHVSYVHSHQGSVYGEDAECIGIQQH